MNMHIIMHLFEYKYLLYMKNVQYSNSYFTFAKVKIILKVIYIFSRKVCYCNLHCTCNFIPNKTC